MLCNCSGITAYNQSPPEKVTCINYYVVEGGVSSKRWCSRLRWSRVLIVCKMVQLNVEVNFRRFYLLLWKNFILQVMLMLLRLAAHLNFVLSMQIRRPIGTAFELILPVLAVLVVIVLR